MKYVLDTCVISEFTKQSPNPKVVAWLRSCDQSALFLSCITIGELAKGIAKLPDGKKKENLAHWLREDLQIRFHERIIALDLEVMLGWGNLCGLLENTGTSVPVMDSLIAACAIAYDMTLVTHNPGDFTAMQVKIITCLSGWLSRPLCVVSRFSSHLISRMNFLPRRMTTPISNFEFTHQV